MSHTARCYACSEPAKEKCKNPDCQHFFCAEHGNFLCEFCLSAPQENEESMRKRARARLTQKWPKTVTQSSGVS